MSTKISGVLIDGAGTPISKCRIILKSKVNTSDVLIKTVADIETGNNGEYSFNAQVGKYRVYLKHDWHDEFSVGDITVYADSKPGTLNDFLTALDEGDLKPDVVRRFESMVEKAMQSASAAASSAQDARLEKENIEELSDDVKKNADAVAENVQTVILLASEVADNVGQVQQDVQSVADAVKMAEGYRNDAQQTVDGLNSTNATTTQKGLVQLSSATDSSSEELAATPKAIKAVMDEVQTRASLESPALIGEPTAPTPAATAAGHEIANAAFVRSLIAALVDSSPGALDTLNELAAALGDDPNFATTMTNALAGKQAISEILTSLSNLATASNKLAYFSDKNVMALANLSSVGRVLIGQASKNDVLTYLELKNAARMDSQGNIYDRTTKQLAIPGMFGFGAVFSYSDRITFDASRPFESWVRSAYPGRYSITESGISTIPGVNFSGVLEVIWNDSGGNSRPEYNAKAIVFYGVNGSLWMNRYWTAGNGYLIGWENLKPGTTAIIDTLSASTGNDWGDPAPGGLILAAYQGERNGDQNIKLVRGQLVSGGRLGAVGLDVAFNPAGPFSSGVSSSVVGCDYHSLPGAYRALSGTKTSYGSKAWLGIFIRVA